MSDQLREALQGHMVKTATGPERIELDIPSVIIPGDHWEALRGAARKWASLTSPETTKVMSDSWGRIRERLTNQTTDTDLWSAISILDHHFGVVLRSVEEGQADE